VRTPMALRKIKEQAEPVRKVVRISWIDSASVDLNDWVSVSDLHKPEPCSCESVGFVLYQDSEMIRITKCISDNMVGDITAGGILDIPMVAVLTITELVNGELEYKK